MKKVIFVFATAIMIAGTLAFAGNKQAAGNNCTGSNCPPSENCICIPDPSAPEGCICVPLTSMGAVAQQVAGVQTSAMTEDCPTTGACVCK